MQGRNEGGKGGTIPLASNHCKGVDLLRQLQYSTFASERSDSTMGAPNLFFAPGTI